MGKITIVIIIISIFSNLLGFVRDVFLSYFFGVSKITDAYFIAYTIPTIIFGLIGYALSTGYIPIFNNIKVKFNKYKSDEFTSNIINILLLISFILVLLLMYFTEELVTLFASGFDNYTLKIAVLFVRITLWSLIFQGVINIFKSYLQVHNKFLLTTAIGIPLNLVLIFFILLASKGSIIFLPFGIVIGTLFQLLFLYPSLRKLGYKHSFIFNFKDTYISLLIKNMIPLVFGVSVYHLNTVVGIALASRIIEGGVSALNYAQRINGIIEGLFIISIITVMFPKIVNKIQSNDMIIANNILNKSIKLLLFLTIPASVGIIALAEPIVKILFGRGAFSHDDLLLTSEIVMYYAMGIVGYGIREILARVFYSFQDTKTPMYNSVLSVLLNIILSLSLVNFFGVSGIALATSIASILSSIFLVILLKRKRNISFINKSFLIFLFKVVFIAIVMGFVTRFIFINLTYNLFLSLFISILIGFLFYIFSSFFLRVIKISEIKTLIN